MIIIVRLLHHHNPPHFGVSAYTAPICIIHHFITAHPITYHWEMESFSEDDSNSLRETFFMRDRLRDKKDFTTGNYHSWDWLY